VNQKSEHKEKNNQHQSSKANADQNNSNKELPAQLKAGLEALSGVDMSGTEVHKNSSLPAQFKAEAFAQGSEIHLAAGQEQHLAHEAWHVVQQKQGRVQPTSSESGIPVNDDIGLETEADQMGAKALQLNIDEASPVNSSVNSGGENVSQMMWNKKMFQDNTNGGSFVRRGSGVEEIDSLVDTYNQLQSDPTTKKEDLVWLCTKIEESIKGWQSYHKGESRQQQRIEKFQEFLDGHLAYERDNVLANRLEDDEEIDLTDGSLKKVANTKTDSDVIQNLKIKHEGGGDELFKKLGAMVNAMVPENGDGAKLEVAVKIPIPVAPGVTAFVGGGLALEAGRDDNMVTTKAEVALLAGVEFLKVVGVEGKLAGFVEAKAGTAAEAIELMSYGLYQRARSGATPASMTNAIWGGGTGSLGFAASEEKMAEKERRIFGPLKEQRDQINARLSTETTKQTDAQNAVQLLLTSSIGGEQKEGDKAKIDAIMDAAENSDKKVEAIQKELKDLESTFPEVTTGGTVAAKATFGAGPAKMEGEISRTSGTKIGLDEIEEAKGDKFGKGRERDEIGQGTGIFGNSKKKMGQSVVGWEAKLAAELSPFGKAELGYKREWAGPPDNREAKGTLSGAVEVVLPISGTVASTAAPYILDIFAKSAGFIATADKDKGETSGKSLAASQAMSISSIGISDVKPKIEAFEGVGVEDPTAPANKASGKVALKVAVSLEDLKKVSFEISYVKETGVSLGGGIFEAKQEKTQRFFKHEWGL
jgi:hypothetical protein